MSFIYKTKAAIAFGSLLFCANVLADANHGVGMELNSDGLKFKYGIM